MESYRNVTVMCFICYIEYNHHVTAEQEVKITELQNGKFKNICLCTNSHCYNQS